MDIFLIVTMNIIRAGVVFSTFSFRHKKFKLVQSRTIKMMSYYYFSRAIMNSVLSFNRYEKILSSYFFISTQNHPADIILVLQQ